MGKLTTIIAILAICALELAALKAGVDGLMLAGAVASIAGLGGFATGEWKAKNDITKKKKG